MIYNFFFQAEDGIRDGHVTGVQTCALPIYYSFPQTFCMLFGRVWKLRVCKTFNSPFPITANPRLPRFLQETWPPTYLLYRSEERRVGKECRAGGETMH